MATRHTPLEPEDVLDRLRGPDVAFSTEETFRKHGNPGERFARFVPDWAIEIDITRPLVELFAKTTR
jgi:hypothetical protein